MRAQEQDREEIAQARARWENDQRKIPVGKLVFIDETHFAAVSSLEGCAH